MATTKSSNMYHDKMIDEKVKDDMLMALLDDYTLRRLVEVMLNVNYNVSNLDILNCDSMNKLYDSCFSGSLVFNKLKGVVQDRLQSYAKCISSDSTNTHRNQEVAFQRTFLRFRGPKYDLAYLAKYLVVSSQLELEDLYEGDTFKCPELTF